MRTLLLLFLSLNGIAQNEAPVSVHVTDFSNQPIVNDKIVFLGVATNKEVIGITSSSGDCHILLPQGDTYQIQIDALGEEIDYSTVEIPKLPEGATFSEMKIFIQYEQPAEITISNLHFKTGSAVVSKESLPELKQLADYLNRKKELRILREQIFT